jgi:hypothetical protein
MSLAACHSPDPEIRAGSFRIDPAELAALGLPPRIFMITAYPGCCRRCSCLGENTSASEPSA